MKRNPTRSVQGRLASPSAPAHPVAVQSMCATRTQDIDATVEQAEAIRKAGGDLVRVAVDSPKDVEALAEVRRQTPRQPGRGPAGELPPGRRRSRPTSTRCATTPGHLYHHEKEKPVRGEGPLPRATWRASTTCALRVGVNCGSVDPEMKARYPGDDVEAMVQSALEHCRHARRPGLRPLRGEPQGLAPAQGHRGATPASPRSGPTCPCTSGSPRPGIPPEGIIKTRVAFEQLLSRGIGDTLRVSLTLPNPRKHEEVAVGQQILDDIAAGRFRSVPVFDDDKLNIISCPSCSRVENERFVELAAGGEGDDGLRRAARPDHRGHGLPGERPRRDRRRRPRPLVRPHPRQPEAEDARRWAPSPTTRSCPGCAQELDALIEARTARARATSRVPGGPRRRSG